MRCPRHTVPGATIHAVPGEVGIRLAGVANRRFGVVAS